MLSRKPGPSSDGATHNGAICMHFNALRCKIRGLKVLIGDQMTGIAHILIKAEGNTDVY